MALIREKIERFEATWWRKPWKRLKSRKWRKKQMNKYIRLQSKKIDEDDVGCKRGTKPYRGWEW